MIAILPAIGAALAGLSFRSGWRRLKLLSLGQVGAAEFVSETGTNMTINDRPVVRLNFEFAGTDGSRQRVSRMTATPDLLRDERQEAVLFDPHDPRHAVLVDELPAGVSADLEGQFTTPPNAGLVIAIPLLTALGNVACAASRLLR